MKTRFVNAKVRYYEVFNTILFCLILLEGLANNLIRTFLPINNILGVVLLQTCILVICSNRMILPKIKVIFILIPVFLLLSSLLGSAAPEAFIYFIQFASFGIAGYLCSCVPLRTGFVLKAGSYLTFFSVLTFFAQKFDFSESTYFNFGYMMMPGILVILSYIYTLYKTKAFFSLYIWSMFCAAISYMAFKYCGRGVFLCIGVYIVLFMLYINEIKWLKAITGLFVTLMITVLLNLNAFITSLQTFLRNYEISIYAINKTVRLLQRTDDISNGRTELFSKVFKNIGLKEICFGRGIAGYEHSVGGTYTHNLFLSIFSDFGIIGILILVFILYRVFRQMKYLEKIDRHIYILLISSYLAKLMFSSVYWRNSGFWMLVGLGLGNYFYTSHTSEKVPPPEQKELKHAKCLYYF